MTAPYTTFTAPQAALILLNGAIGGAVWSLIAHVVRRYTRHILAAVLIAAAAFYVLFARRGDAGAAWVALELLGVALFAALAVAGVRGSLWWLVLGWSLHPAWDLPLHYFGPGHAFAPEPYAIACLAWDWVTAGYLAWRAVRATRALATPARLDGRRPPTVRGSHRPS